MRQYLVYNHNTLELLGTVYGSSHTNALRAAANKFDGYLDVVQIH